MFFCFELKSHDFQLKVVLVVLKRYSFVQLMFSILGFLLVFLFQFQIALFINFCFDQPITANGVHPEFREMLLNCADCIRSFSEIAWRFVSGIVADVILSTFFAFVVPLSSKPMRGYRKLKLRF